MRLVQVGLILCLCSSLASAYTFVFKTGKQIEGTIQYEDSTTIRIVDASSVAMSLNRNSLNFDATAAANPVVVEPQESETTEQEEAGSFQAEPARASSVQINREIHSEKYWKDRLQKAKKDYSRLQQDCRIAGGSRTGNETLQTRKYLVNGKTVRVTGYWADPENIRSANAVCKKALKAQAEIIEAANELESIRQKNEASTVSTSAGVTGPNK